MTNDTLGVLLAGGQSRRMGVMDKFLLLHDNQTLLQHCLNLARPQVAELVISANGDPDRLADYALPVVPDLWPTHPGPLAGIISVMSWAQKARKQYAWLATFATDTPYFPLDLVSRLKDGAIKNQCLVAVAQKEDELHYAFALWSMTLLPMLLDAFHGGERALHKVTRNLAAHHVQFHGNTADFINLNTPHDWERLR